MALRVSDLFVIAKKVTIGNVDVEIRPLTLEQIIRLLTVYREDIITMFSDTVSGELNMITLVATAPRMVADILAFGMDADGQQNDIMKLPGFTQVELLAEVWKVSIPEPKKLYSLLSGAMAGLQQAGINPALPSEETTQDTTESTIPTAVEPPPTTS